MKTAQAKETAQAIFAEHKSPFGAFSLGSETHQATTIPDAVRRCRWIAIDIGAVEFGVFFVSPSLERSRLVPIFDSSYPATSVNSKFLAGSNGEDIVRNARTSTLPCLWQAASGSADDRPKVDLPWMEKIAVPVPDSDGIAFPVYAERGQCGSVVFLGPDLALTAETLHEIHARCFSLFSAVARIRPSDGNSAVPSISKRELECLKLTANGYTSEEIARLLKLSVHTANQYLSNTTQKLHAVNRMHAVAKALRLGLIE